jgi:hypothetical protein
MGSILEARLYLIHPYYSQAYVTAQRVVQYYRKLKVTAFST